MANVAWTPAAETDLEGVFLYIARDQLSPLAAERVVRDIVSKAEIYAAQPQLAMARPEFGPDIRSFHVHRFVVVYRPVDEGIEVIRVIHGSRDVFRIMGREGR